MEARQREETLNTFRRARRAGRHEIGSVQRPFATGFRHTFRILCARFSASEGLLALLCGIKRAPGGPSICCGSLSATSDTPCPPSPPPRFTSPATSTHNRKEARHEARHSLRPIRPVRLGHHGVLHRQQLGRPIERKSVVKLVFRYARYALSAVATTAFHIVGN
jgi:hypothetical protein